MKLQGKTALVTGGATGLGLAITKQLLEKDVKVSICGRTQEYLDQAKSEISSESLTIYQCDISDYSQVESMVKQIGPVDILINNAGLWLEGELDSYSVEQIDQTIKTNLMGTIYCTYAILPEMRKRGEAAIINISSTSGVKAKDVQSVYCASKFGVRGFTDSLKMDLKPTNIKVVGFYPGGMNTKMFEKAGNPKENQDWMNPSEVAKAVIFVLQQEEHLVADHIVINKRHTKSTNK